MKTVTYRDMYGQPIIVEYDETAPCRICGEPVREASMGGTEVCPSCDLGRCRYCGVSCGMLLRTEIDGGESLRRWREHMQWHRRQKPVAPPDAKETP